ncbi:MAG TPA: hypothetical protein IAA51_15105 [Candidatus Cottocaccamicrobium excrementipullorum]|nr:hypothetical protein [Candidatus Cottocaccamicrobium excrementipullorum]
MSIERKNCTQEKGRKILVKSNFFRKELNLANGQNIQNGSEKGGKGGNLDKCEQEYEKVCVENAPK